MAAFVEVRGLRQLQGALKGFEKDIADAPRTINKEAAALVQRAAEQIAPRRTGRLARSIRPRGSGSSAYLSSDLVYARPIHFGWARHHIRANPFLYRAADQKQGDVERLYEKRLQELAAKVRGI